MLATDPQRCLETPPRTWRRLRLSIAYLFQIGNTSTDVEKTFFSACQAAPSQKHLHGRGEDDIETGSSDPETPPRTWRRPEVEVTAPAVTRNTSTDVEKTYLFRFNRYDFKKHLHGRGEDRKTSTPFARSRGNTSTDVEKTVLNRDRYRVVQKHLHGRGEDAKNARQAHGQRETPPRTWRRLNIHAQLFCQC